MDIKKAFTNSINKEAPSIKNLLPSLILLMLGSLLTLDGLEVDSLVCSRTGQAPHTCEISRNSLFQKKIVKQFPLSHLKEARLEKPDRKTSSKYRMVFCTLVTEAEIIKFGTISSGGVKEKQEIVSKINSFLQNQNQVDLLAQESPKFRLILIGIFIALLGLFLFYSCLYSIYPSIKSFFGGNKKK